MEGGHECVMPTQEYFRKIIEDASEDDHFTHGAWIRMVEYLNVEGGIASGCFDNMKTFCKNEKLENVVAIIKSCKANALSELTTRPNSALHPIDVENYDASHSDDEDEAEKDVVASYRIE
ncbi:hypothetical protein Tco_0937710 [Tanacetum coccineum]|uniref:Uncharacterized protein n=1 Tax=Tanacetum coccineum TaxID=301880 RepID=A0ABQ5DF20_9ASTR